MKKYKDIGNYDFSDYAEVITGDALFKINGGNAMSPQEIRIYRNQICITGELNE